MDQYASSVELFLELEITCILLNDAWIWATVVWKTYQTGLEVMSGTK